MSRYKKEKEKETWNEQREDKIENGDDGLSDDRISRIALWKYNPSSYDKEWKRRGLKRSVLQYFWKIDKCSEKSDLARIEPYTSSTLTSLTKSIRLWRKRWLIEWSWR